VSSTRVVETAESAVSGMVETQLKTECVGNKSGIGFDVAHDKTFFYMTTWPISKFDVTVLIYIIPACSIRSTVTEMM
jgi:hypothetical protein